MVKKREYVVALVNDDKHALRPREWAYLERLFSKYPGLCRLEAPARMYADI